MELKLEHLAGYLPYGLKGIYIEDNIGLETMISLSTNVGGTFVEVITNHDAMDIHTFKPILKPLSDLIDNILDDNNDANYQLSCELAELLNTTDSSYFVKALINKTYYAVDVRLWNDIETWLNKNHFDWKYNLIENGLAIDVNTLTPSPNQQLTK